MIPNNNDNNGNRNPTWRGDQLRDYDELEGTLLPTASLVEPASSSSSSAPAASQTLKQTHIPTARPISSTHNNHHQERAPTLAASAATNTTVFEDEPGIVESALLIPPVPNDEGFGGDDDAVLARAQRMGKLASETERMNVVRENHHKVHAYNNQAELDLDRANEVARIENYREHQLLDPIISDAAAATSSCSTTTTTTTTQQATTQDHQSKKKGEDNNCFPTRVKGGGYEVKEYVIGDYDSGGYSYDIAEYKSDYD